MFKNSDKKLILPVLAAGIMYGLSFPPVNLYFLIFISLSVIISILKGCKNFRQVFFRSYFTFFTASLVGVSWIALSGIRDGADPFLILGGVFIIFIYPLFFVLPSVVFYYINKNLASKNNLLSLFIFPFVWTGFEFVSSLGQISFPWLLSGYSQTYNLSKIQFAEYTGVFGVSFWICVIAALIYYVNFYYKNRTKSFTSPGFITAFLILAAVYFLPDFYTKISDSEKKFTDFKSNGTVKVGIIQPNINPWKKWGGKQIDLIQLYAENIREINSANPDLDLAVLPETAFPYYFRESFFEDKYEIIKNVCDSTNLPLLTGTPDLQIYEDQSSAPVDAKIMKRSGLKYDTYNSAFLFEPGKDKSEFQKHYKVKLVIGSERMPYQELFPFTKNLVEWGVGLSSWQMGKDLSIFQLKGKKRNYRFNTAICYESVYPEFFSEFVKQGTDFSVIITNDGWWGKLFGTYQHNQFAVFRSIENRTWIVRCANTGISCFIDPYGKMYDKSEIDVSAELVREIGVKGDNTFYTENGDLFAKICLYSSLFMLLISFVIRPKKIYPHNP